MDIQCAACIRRPTRRVNGFGASMAGFICINLRSSVAKRRCYVHVFAGILRSDLVAPELVFALEQAAGLARTPGAGRVGGNELAIARPLPPYRGHPPPPPLD